MKPAGHNHAVPLSRRARRARRRADGGLTLIEMIVALGIGSLVLLVVTMLSVYALRSFGAMGNYTILDARSRTAQDKITRDLREAILAQPPYADASVKWLQFTNPVRGGTFKYVWYPDERRVVCDRGESEEIYLTDCDEWSFALYQRTPLANSPNAFAPATNWDGSVNPGDCKMIELNWKCSRALLGKQWGTESAGNIRVTLRNNN